MKPPKCCKKPMELKAVNCFNKNTKEKVEVSSLGRNINKFVIISTINSFQCKKCGKVERIVE